MNTTLDLIRTRLNECLAPTLLELTDDSQQHQGHAGASRGGGHFSVRICSDAFEGQSLVACHQMVYRALGDLMTGPIHAVQITILGR